MQLESWSWRRAFCEEACLPSSVMGPVERFALARLAWICFSVAIGLGRRTGRSEARMHPRVARVGEWGWEIDDVKEEGNCARRVIGLAGVVDGQSIFWTTVIRRALPGYRSQ